MAHFEDMSPEALQLMARVTMDTAAKFRSQPMLEQVMMSSSGTLMALSQVVDRLDRIILLLDERLPRAQTLPTDDLEGTVESRG